MSETPQLNAKIIEEAAQELFRKAKSLPRAAAVVGALVGAVFGGVPLTPLGHVWPIPAMFGFATLLIGALCGMIVGYAVGEGRSRMLEVRAQTTLTQAYLVRRAAATAHELERLAAQIAHQRQVAPPPAPAPAPQPLAQLPPQPLRPVALPPEEPPVVAPAASQAGPPLSPPVSS